MKKLHICLNFVGDAGWMGGAIYSQNLVRAISSLPAEERNNIRLSIAVSKSNLGLVEPIQSYVDQVFVNRSLYLKLGKVLAERFKLIPLQLLNPLHVDFVYPTFAWQRSPYLWGGWIPDFQHHYLPHIFSAEDISNRDSYYKSMVENAPVIILSSQMAQEHFNEIYPEFRHKGQLLQFASSLDPNWFEVSPKSIQSKYQLPDEFFLVSNQFWKHKNHDVVVEALDILRHQGIKPTVACTGNTRDPRDLDYFNRLQLKIEELDLSNQIRILGLIPRIDQIQLMRRCLAVLQPSLFEGWSTVIEDARTLGKSIIASDFPVHLEQNPPKACFFERNSPEQLASHIVNAMSNLNPGPDPESELIAREDNSARMVDFGRRFLEIANKIVT